MGEIHPSVTVEGPKAAMSVPISYRKKREI
jgi:hypothetical protein